MFDRLQIKAQIGTPIVYKEMEYNFIKVGDLKLIEQRNSMNFDYVKYVRKYKNLNFTVIGSELTISNSIHKFINGDNYSDFTYSNLIQFVFEIEELTKIPSDKLFIKKLDFSLNIEVEKKPYQYLPLFETYKNKEFDKMKSQSFWYGIKYIFNEFNVKIYDKNAETKRQNLINLPKNILRMEIEYKRKRIVPKVGTLKELLIKDNIIFIYKDFIKRMSKIELKNDIKVANFKNSRDREIFFAGKNPYFWQMEKALNINTYKDKKKRYNSIKKEVEQNNLMNEFIEQLELKFQQLINK